MIIGITGPSGSGKSLASQFFKEKGFEVIDFDELSRKVTQKGSECLDELRAVFGEKVFAPDGTLLRRELGDIVFADGKKLSILNSITHKYILEEADKLIKMYAEKNIIFDAPLLFEAELDKKCDYTISILASPDVRIKRICERDGISEKSAINRIKSQKSDSFYLEKSDFSVCNNTDVSSLRLELANILRRKAYEPAIK